MPRNYKVEKSELSERRFNDILESLNLTKASLAREMGLSIQTSKSWFKNNDMPLYVERYLVKLLELKKYKDIQKKIKEIDSIFNIPLIVKK